MTTFGSNIGYVDELYARYLADPASVSEAWREFFADYRPGAPPPAPGARLEEELPRPIAPPPAAPSWGDEDEPAPAGAEPLRGIAGKIAENMAESLAVPTATSVRTIPVKLLEENRRLVNQHQSAVSSFKVSYTHMIAWAIVRAIEAHPGMNAAFAAPAGVPHRVPRPDVNLGLAIDVERRGERILLVPNVKAAQALDFPSFVAAYDDRVARARANRLSVEDFQGTTATLTNPGMIGTVLSVPRLMPGQGTIVGVGAIGYPAEYRGMAPEVISELGLAKVMTVTSTYDHRVIQGAESGAFLATLEGLLQGKDGFYDRIFAELAVPHEPLKEAGDRNPPMFGASGNTEAIAKQASVLTLIRAYRVRGHLYAELDPLGAVPVRESHPELELSHYGLSHWDLDRRFVAGGLAGSTGTLTLREILDTLRETYCRHIGVEYYHIADTEIRHWLQERMEGNRNAEPIDAGMRQRILGRLNAASAFETFLHTAYIGHKRFSLEGAETLVPMLDVLLSDAAAMGVEQAVMGMAHRGRLNVLVNVVGKPLGAIFREFEGAIDPDSVQGSGDVKYHLGSDGLFVAPDRRKIRLTLASNPSHLEAVDPVVEGMARARQDRIGEGGRGKVLPILIHGDAAFAGQGVVAETLNLSELRGYRTGGTVHIVINNQIGFTTGPKDARSSPYSTDVAKMVRAPIFHVNGDYPEDAVRVIRLALAFRQTFHRDVVVDLVCYRRWGHNEGDDPSYTHPLLYARIEARRPVRKIYTEQLLRRGDLTVENAEKSLEDFRTQLQKVFDEVHAAQQGPEPPVREEREEVEGAAPPPVPTGVERAVLERVLEGLDRTPPGFSPHPKLARQLSRRKDRFAGGKVDWALAESLAFGSLLLEGTPVRLSGEDSGRGTFSQRHAVLYDHTNATPYVPLANLSPDQATFSVWDSHLSEFAVLGFEYGYSVDTPEALVLWEAQFGDFVNGAQVILDQFLVSAEEKWNQRSGLVLLLPHGYEGQGPEHSSARIERFLQLAARGNIQVCYPSTPAQYFHLLRRQVRRDPRKPLVIFTPKSVLRLPAAVSTAEDLASGAFREVLDDPRQPDPKAVRRLLLCSGKIFWELDEQRRRANAVDVALARLEQFYPFPQDALAALLARYGKATEIAWAQEEPRNMGGWDFVEDRIRTLLKAKQELRYAGRPRSPSPSTGSLKRHLAEQKAIVEEAIGRAAPADAPVEATAATSPVAEHPD